MIALPENIGFAAGNNVGLRRAKGAHWSCSTATPSCCPTRSNACVRYLDANPDVGVAGPQLLNPDGSQAELHPQLSELRHRALVPKGLLETLFPRRYPFEALSALAEPIPVEAVLGACLFVRREVLESVGLMPEDYFFFLEETDWCFRIA